VTSLLVSLIQNSEMTNKEIADTVRAVVPDARTSKGSVAWYRSKVLAGKVHIKPAKMVGA